MKSFDELARMSEDLLRGIVRTKRTAPESSVSSPVYNEIYEMMHAADEALGILTEREKATGTDWVDQLKDVADTTADLGKDIHEAYLVERKAIDGEGEPHPDDPEKWLTSFKDRVEGLAAQLEGVLMAHKKSSREPEDDGMELPTDDEMAPPPPTEAPPPAPEARAPLPPPPPGFGESTGRARRLATPDWF